MDLDKLLTEARNAETVDIDRLSTLEAVKKINAADKSVALAVEKVLPQIAAAVDLVVKTLQNGGRLIYVGAGTSGRLGILDASECPPTYGISPESVQGIIAGGKDAVFAAVEGAEDKPHLAAADLKKRRLTKDDLVCGIAASGRTPYVVGALEFAAATGCKTIALVNSPQSELEKIASLTICAAVGAEVITGSTRMKAGTAQKMILNMLSTAAMIRLGKVFSNLMVDVTATNEKLNARANRIIQMATGCDSHQAQTALTEANNSVKTAIVMLLKNIPPQEAAYRLAKAQGFVCKALE
jgi:N-acetylmuramic acid 6-phosphate etherase